MASQAAVWKNEERKRLVKVYKERRDELRKMMKDPRLSAEQKEEVMLALQKLPRDSSPTRVRNRCFLTGRPRGYYRKFGLSRIALRDLALRGDLPGVTKASW
jgi:small subunit ribosomal protein S14